LPAATTLLSSVNPSVSGIPDIQQSTNVVPLLFKQLPRLCGIFRKLNADPSINRISGQ